MATSKNLSGGKIPDGFVSPFTRVEQRERNDDALACIATITGKTLDEVTQIALQKGYPKHGPAFVTNALITKVLYELGFTGGEYVETPSIAHLPTVAILSVDYQGADSDIGRHIVWHHVRGTDAYPSFSYVIDVGDWVPEAQRITSDFSHIRFNPSWYIEVQPRTNGKSKKA
jgi:hypothetical protein